MKSVESMAWGPPGWAVPFWLEVLKFWLGVLTLSLAGSHRGWAGGDSAESALGNCVDLQIWEKSRLHFLCPINAECLVIRAILSKYLLGIFMRV